MAGALFVGVDAGVLVLGADLLGVAVLLLDDVPLLCVLLVCVLPIDVGEEVAGEVAAALSLGLDAVEGADAPDAGTAAPAFCDPVSWLGLEPPPPHAARETTETASRDANNLFIYMPNLFLAS